MLTVDWFRIYFTLRYQITIQRYSTFASTFNRCHSLIKIYIRNTSLLYGLADSIEMHRFQLVEIRLVLYIFINQNKRSLFLRIAKFINKEYVTQSSIISIIFIAAGLTGESLCLTLENYSSLSMSSNTKEWFGESYHLPSPKLY